MKNLTVFTLVGCSVCADLKHTLISKNIEYKEISCSGNRDTICDKNAFLLDNNLYPYCSLNSSNVKIYICITYDSSKLGVVAKLSNTEVIYYVDSIVNMYNTILKL
jgi:hypothetical protein